MFFPCMKRKERREYYRWLTTQYKCVLDCFVNYLWRIDKTVNPEYVFANGNDTTNYTNRECTIILTVVIRLQSVLIMFRITFKIFKNGRSVNNQYRSGCVKQRGSYTRSRMLKKKCSSSVHFLNILKYCFFNPPWCVLIRTALKTDITGINIVFLIMQRIRTLVSNIFVNNFLGNIYFDIITTIPTYSMFGYNAAVNYTQ